MNVAGVINLPKPPKTIGDMQPGEYGYTVPWAYNSGGLLEYCHIERDKCGTANLYVECITRGRYIIEFEPEQEIKLRRKENL